VTIRLDDERRAFAEMRGEVPLVCAAQGVQLAVAVPSEMAERADGLIALFEPTDPLPRAVPLEMAETESKLLSPTASGWRVELSVRNPHTFPVIDPTIVVDLQDAHGSVIRTWRGSLRARIEPGATLRFRSELPVPDDAEPGRVNVRGYADRT